MAPGKSVLEDRQRQGLQIAIQNISERPFVSHQCIQQTLQRKAQIKSNTSQEDCCAVKGLMCSNVANQNWGKTQDFRLKEAVPTLGSDSWFWLTVAELDVVVVALRFDPVMPFCSLIL